MTAGYRVAVEFRHRSWVDDTGTIFLMFNNCHEGKAARNARMIQSLLET